MGAAAAPALIGGLKWGAGALASQQLMKSAMPEVPQIAASPTAPSEGDAEVQAAKKKERKVSRLRSGRQSTILSNLRQQLSPGTQGGAGAQLG